MYSSRLGAVSKENQAQMEIATERDDEGRYQIVVVTNALKVMNDLGQFGPTSINDLVARTGLSRSAVYRILVTLEAMRFAMRDRGARNWSLGPAFLLAHRAALRDVVKVIAAPSLRRLHEKFRETINLAQFHEGRLTYTEILESPQPLAARETPGDEAPLATTALGRAVLSALPEDDPLVEAVCSDAKSPRSLRADLAEVRSRGWAAEEGETLAGVACLGSAILDPTGLPIGGISVSLPEARLSKARALDIGRAVKLEARLVSEALAES
jgi:DNA-binding IclR family transcriptional regulator